MKITCFKLVPVSAEEITNNQPHVVVAQRDNESERIFPVNIIRTPDWTSDSPQGVVAVYNTKTLLQPA